MATVKDITATGRTYLQSNEGLDISYAVASSAIYTGVIRDAGIDYNDIGNKIVTNNAESTGVHPAGSLPLLDEMAVPSPNDATLILNTLFRFQDLNLGVGNAYGIKSMFLMKHDDADGNVFTGDEVMAIVTEDDANTNIYAKGNNTSLTVNIALRYDSEMRSQDVDITVLQTVTEGAPEATTSVSGTRREATENEVLNGQSNGFVTAAKLAARFARLTLGLTQTDIIARIRAGRNQNSTEAGIVNASLEEATDPDSIKLVAENLPDWKDGVHTKTTDFVATDVTGTVGDIYIVHDA